MDRAERKKSTFTIDAGELAPNEIEVHRVRIRVLARQPETVDWSQASTCGEMKGSYGGGFLNTVTMEGDSDGPENNYGCAPTTTRDLAHLALIKVIQDENGNPVSAVSSKATDASSFLLHADRIGGGQALMGASLRSGEKGVDSNVITGRYHLYEVANDQIAYRYLFNAQWSCIDENSRSTTVAVEQGDIVEVKSGQSVTCTITNRPIKKIHVKKVAADPSRDNPHIGKKVKPDSDGTLTMRYVIELTNDSSVLIDNSGPIYDNFTIPRGLVWNDAARDPRAKVTFDANGTQASTLRDNTVIYMSKNNLLSQLGGIVTRGVKNFNPGDTVRFLVEIPLRVDTSPIGSSAQTTFDAMKDSLKECETKTSGQGNPYTTTNKGVPNVTRITGEDMTYSDIAAEDNIACIPVVPPEQPFYEMPPIPLTGGGIAKDLIVMTGIGLLTAGFAGGIYQRRRQQMAMR